MKTNQTTAASTPVSKQAKDWTFPIVSWYRDEDGHRNASIAIFNDGDDERYGKFRINISHQGWTGVRWFSINQDDNAYTIEQAFEKARNARDAMGWRK